MQTQVEQAIDYKELVKEILNTVLVGPEYKEEAIDQYFDKNFIQYVEGRSLGFEGPEGFQKFKNHLQKIRAFRIITGFKFNTLVQEGNTLFSSHIVASTKPDGSDLSFRKVIAHFQFKQEKVAFCDEVTVLLNQD